MIIWNRIKMQRKALTKIVFFITTLLLISACGKSKKDQYLGYWFEEGKVHESPLHIVKEGEKLYIKTEKWEAPVTYNEKDQTLEFNITNGLMSLPGVLNISDEKERMKLSLGENSAELIWTSDKDAEEKIKKAKEYYDPSFFVGKWQSTDEGSVDLTISKIGDEYYIETNKTTTLKYDEKNKRMIYISAFYQTNKLQRSGDDELLMNGSRTYKRVK